MRKWSPVMCLIAMLYSGGFPEALSTHWQRRVPVGAEVVFVDYPSPPATLKEMVAEAEIVALGVITHTDRPSALEGAVYRIHTFQPVEVVKGANDQNVPPLLRVRQAGGTASVGDVEISTPYPSEVLKTGGQYVLFLRGRQAGSYEVAYGSGGMFELDLTTLHVHVPSITARVVREMGGRSMIEKSGFLDLIRSLSKAK